MIKKVISGDNKKTDLSLIWAFCVNRGSYEIERIVFEFMVRGIMVSPQLYKYTADFIFTEHPAVYFRFAGTQQAYQEELIKTLDEQYPSLWYPDKGTHHLGFDFRSKIECWKVYKDIPELHFPESYHACTAKEMKAISKKMPYPWLMKRAVSSHGEGNVVVENTKALNVFIREHEHILGEYLVQKRHTPYIAYRVLVIGDMVIGKFRLPKKDGRFDMVPDISREPLCSQLEQIAVMGTRTLGADFAGVDILIDQDQIPHLLEVNINPQFESAEHKGINVAGVFVDYYIQRSRRFYS